MVGLEGETKTPKKLVESVDGPGGSQCLLFDLAVPPFRFSQRSRGVCNWSALP